MDTSHTSRPIAGRGVRRGRVAVSVAAGAGRGSSNSASSTSFQRKVARTPLFQPIDDSAGETSDGDTAAASMAKRLERTTSANNAFDRDPSIVDTDAEAARKSRFETTVYENRFIQLKPHRERERRDAIAAGLIPDPLKPRRLDEAIVFNGTCQDMCPEFEREEREFQKNVDRWELRPGTNRIDPKRAVKAFHRPAAGNEQPMPSDVRPPEVLKRTLDYLFHDILAQDPDLMDSHPFLRDRTRAVRQDFTLQNERGSLAIECHERIARYHILCLHKLREWDSFSESQELEQLRKVLQSLNEFYDDARQEGLPCPCEAEFRAYHLITHLRDSDTIRQTESLPLEIFDSPYVQAATRLHALAQRNNESRGERGRRPANSEASLNAFSLFFKAVAGPKTPYLLACLAESHFFDIRRGALVSLRKAFIPQQPQYPLTKLAKMLGCDSVAHTAEVVENFGLEVTYSADDVPVSVELHRGVALTEYPAVVKQRASRIIVEQKRGQTSLQTVIDGKPFSTISPSTGQKSPPSHVRKKSASFAPVASSTVAQSPTSALDKRNITLGHAPLQPTLATGKLNVAASVFVPKSSPPAATPFALDRPLLAPPAPRFPVKQPSPTPPSTITSSARIPSTQAEQSKPSPTVHTRTLSSMSDSQPKRLAQSGKSPTARLRPSLPTSKSISKSVIASRLCNLLSEQVLTTLSYRAATEGLATANVRIFRERDAQRRQYVEKCVKQLYKRLADEVAHRASSEVVADTYAKRIMCRKVLIFWRRTLTRNRSARAKLASRRLRFSEVLSKLPATPARSVEVGKDDIDDLDVSMLCIDDSHDYDGDDIDRDLGQSPNVSEFRKDFWRARSMANLIAASVNDGFASLKLSQPEDWTAIIFVSSSKSNIALWWRIKLGISKDEDECILVKPYVRVRFVLATFGNLDPPVNNHDVGLIMVNEEVPDIGVPQAVVKRYQSTSRFKAAMIRCRWYSSSSSPLSDVVDVDSLDLNGGLAHALSSRLQRIQANKSFPSELRMSAFVQPVFEAWSSALRRSLAEAAHASNSTLQALAKEYLGLLTEAIALLQRYNAESIALEIPAWPESYSEMSICDACMKYVSLPEVTNQPSIQYARLRLMNGRTNDADTLANLLLSVSEAARDQYAKVTVEPGVRQLDKKDTQKFIKSVTAAEWKVSEEVARSSNMVRRKRRTVSSPSETSHASPSKRTREADEVMAAPLVPVQLNTLTSLMAEAKALLS